MQAEATEAELTKEAGSTAEAKDLPQGHKGDQKRKQPYEGKKESSPEGHNSDEEKGQP